MKRGWSASRPRLRTGTSSSGAGQDVTVEGIGCLWWTGAISGRRHGRFWYASGRVVIAHRFAFAVAHNVAALAGAELLDHRCDNPLCQRVHPEHVVRST